VIGSYAGRDYRSWLIVVVRTATGNAGVGVFGWFGCGSQRSKAGILGAFSGRRGSQQPFVLIRAVKFDMVFLFLILT
jgi:hypothetical protein